MPEIPLNGGLITQADPEEVGIQGCTELVNAEFDKIGRLYKRSGRGVAVSIENNVIKIIKWHDKENNVYLWAYITSDGIFRLGNSGDSWTTTQIFNITPGAGNELDIKPSSGAIRFPAGISENAHIYINKIDRDFFWNGDNPTPANMYDIARPRDIISANTNFSQNKPVIQTDGTIIDANLYQTIFSDTDNDEKRWFGGTLNLSTASYFYRYCLVFDGNQESKLSNLIADTTYDTTSTNAIAEFALDINVGSSLANWNKRVTGINIYRSTSIDGTYYKVGAVSTLLNDPNLIRGTYEANAVNKSIAYINSGETLTGTDLTNTHLVFNTFKSTIAGHEPNIQREHTISTGQGELGEVPKITNIYHTGFHINGKDVTYTTTSGTERATTDEGGFIQDSATNVYLFDSDTTTTGWTNEDGTIAITTDSSYSIYEDASKYSLEIRTNSTGTAKTAYKQITLEADKWYVFCDYLTYYSNGDEIAIGIGTDPTDDNWELAKLIDFKGGGAGTPYGLAQSGKRYFQQTFYSGSTTLAYIKVRLKSASSMAYSYHDRMRVSKLKADGRGFKYYAGKDVFCSNELLLGNADSHEGLPYEIRTTSSTLNYDTVFSESSNQMHKGFIKQNSRKAIRVHPLKGDLDTISYSDDPYGISIGKASYEWEKQTNRRILTFYDQGLTDGVEHPYGQTSNDVKFKHSCLIDGRQYVADVKITDDGEEETHSDWIMYSVFQQPDNIPIINYIQVTDIQGGKIIGLESLLGDLVVLTETGIYRLQVPTEDPSGWSLYESEENIGCISKKSISKKDDGLFFASLDNLYFLNANFKATPLTSTIRDDYQSLVTSNCTTHYDIKSEKLLCKFGSDSSTTIYVLDLTSSEERWSKVTYDASDGYIDLLTSDQNGVVWSYDKTTDKVTPFDDSKTETTSLSRKTGWISNNNLEGSMIIKRMNFRYNSGDNITVKVYTDGDTTTARTWADGNTYGTLPANTSGTKYIRLRPGIRCKYFMIEITSAKSSNDVEINKMEFEVG